MGYVAPPPPPPDHESYMATLYTLARIYDVGSQLLGASRKPLAQRVIESGARMWADLHVEALGWGLLAAVAFLVLFVAWPR